MSQEFFDLSSTKSKRFNDDNYSYELYNQEGKLVIYIHSTRRLCRKAKPININIPDTIDYNINLLYCFSNHQALTDISALKSLDTSRVIGMSEMFYNCVRLKDLTPISSWDVSNVKDMSGMFSRCRRITTLQPLERWNPPIDVRLRLFYTDTIYGSNFRINYPPRAPSIFTERRPINQLHVPDWAYRSSNKN